jgi:hypothetical protein
MKWGFVFFLRYTAMKTSLKLRHDQVVTQMFTSLLGSYYILFSTYVGSPTRCDGDIDELTGLFLP